MFLALNGILEIILQRNDMITKMKKKMNGKSVACCASLHIHNVLAKGAQHKSVVKSKVDDCTSWSIHSTGRLLTMSYKISNEF